MPKEVRANLCIPECVDEVERNRKHSHNLAKKYKEQMLINDTLKSEHKYYEVKINSLQCDIDKEVIGI